MAKHQTLADLPVAAQHAISSAIGQDQSAYHATSAATWIQAGRKMFFIFRAKRSAKTTHRRNESSRKARLERLEDRLALSYLTNPAPTVTSPQPDTYVLRKELYGYANYGVADDAADVLYSQEAGQWRFDLTCIPGFTGKAVQQALFTIAGVLDDHYSVAGSYIGIISTNGVAQFSGDFPYQDEPHLTACALTTGLDKRFRPPFKVRVCM